MPEYRRSWVPGGTYFFTAVTYNRQPILTTVESRNILRSAWQDVCARFPFTIDAVCLLPDHGRVFIGMSAWGIMSANGGQPYLKK